MRGMRASQQMRMTGAAVAVAVVASGAGVACSTWVAVVDARALVNSALSAAVVVSLTVVGAVVASARPGNRVGWLMLAGGALWGVGNGGVDLASHGLVAAPGSVPGASAWALSGGSLRAVGWFAVTLGVPVLFPDGRLMGVRWRWLFRGVLLGAGLSVLGTLTALDANLNSLGSWQNPLAVPPALRPASGLISLLSLAVGAGATVAAIIQLRGRWRRGGPVERQQLTLLGVAAALPVVVGPLTLSGLAGSWLFSASVLPLPFAIGFAVLARGLYDLRTGTNRTLVWVTLSSVVVGLYALVIGGLGGLLDVAGASWLAWVAATVIAVLFAPLRDVLQRAVNRLTYGRWDEPYDVLAALGQHLKATADVDGLLANVANELRRLGLVGLTVCDLHGQVLAGQALGGTGSVVMTLSAYGRPVGTLRYQGSGTQLRPRDRRLLDDLASHLGGVLHAHQLTSDLQRALERVVLAREEERRRLRRDLHDGVGPALAGHLLRLDLISGTLGHDSASACGINTLREELRTTVLEVRRVVEGLRPPALDELGLAAALDLVTQRLCVGASVTVQLDVAELPPLPAAMEVAAFRIVGEAVTNVVRHAGATHCRVSIAVVDGTLRVQIADDGRGLGTAHSLGSGHGLNTMRERAEELSGRFHVSSGPGTTLAAEFPLPPSARPASAQAATAARG